MMKEILKSIKKDLIESSTAEYKKGFQRFFKEPVKCYGVKSSDVGIISKKYWKEIKSLSKSQIFKLCEELLKTDYSEDTFLVSSWLPKLAGSFKDLDINIFEKWINKYINNWAKCDGFCCGTISSYLEKYPKSVDRLKAWSKSKNIWLKRASAVSLVPQARKGNYLKLALEISKTLLSDPADMVQKGYGWLLKEESRLNTNEIFNFVIKNKKEMPRTALRYAIELMPKELKQKAMSKSQ